MIYTCRWLLPIDGPPIEHGWIEIEHNRIRGLGRGVPPARPHDLGDVALLPGLVNAHTHLELSWMAGLVPPAESMDAWIRALLKLRRAGPPGGPEQVLRAARDAAATMAKTGTVLVGDITNSLISPRVLADAGLGGVVFHELLGFDAADPALMVKRASAQVEAEAAAVAHAHTPIHATVVAHAPYSVSPALFREIASHASDVPLAVHLGESPEEIEFLRTGQGPMRALLETLGVWTELWPVPACDPVEYMRRVGYLQRGMLAVHAVHLTDEALATLAEAEAVVVTCPRSNLWVGAGMPRVAHFYAAGLTVAIGTDSLASVATLNLFDELAELRRLAPDVTAASLLDSATRAGAEALGFGSSFGTLTPGKRAALVAVDVPASVTDVEEYLVSGVPVPAVRRVS
jgi:cytosine/adenosine deaminase-related metal-dependent hydrolase